jgi:hypothetical protein
MEHASIVSLSIWRGQVNLEDFLNNNDSRSLKVHENGFTCSPLSLPCTLCPKDNQLFLQPLQDTTCHRILLQPIHQRPLAL